MLSPQRNTITTTSTSKTLIYTISFVFLFLFMEYSLNYIRSTSSSFTDIVDPKNRKSESELSELSSQTSFASLSSSLIEKEKLLIEKEEKYVIALQKLNERDLKLNYVERTMNKLQSLLDKYKTHTKNLETKLKAFQSKHNSTEGNYSKEAELKLLQLKKEIILIEKEKAKAQGLQSMNENSNNLDGQQHIERVIKIEENYKIIDKYEDEYILSNKKELNESQTQIVDFRLIFDLGIVLIAATFGGIIASLFSQPLILGYLLGGSLVGPGGLRLIQQYIQVETLAHIGSIFLLFEVGMQFKYKKISKYLYLSICALLLCCLVLYIVCYVWFKLISNEETQNISVTAVSVFVFATLNTSTTIVLKTWTDTIHTKDTESKNIITAILLVQDIYFIFFMTVFSSVTQQNENENFIYKLLMVVIIFTIVFKSLPYLLSYLRKLISTDIYILFTVSLCIIFTLVTHSVFESSGLGAFVAGLLVSNSHTSDESSEHGFDDKILHKNWVPIRNIFGVLFFASIGMLINPNFLFKNCIEMCSLVVLVGLGKFAMVYLSVYYFQNKKNENMALNVSTSLCFQGEFAFVLSAHAHLDGLISIRMHTCLLGSTAISILITPFVIRHFTAWGLHWQKKQTFLKDDE